jgi:hypothetical protein
MAIMSEYSCIVIYLPVSGKYINPVELLELLDSLELLKLVELLDSEQRPWARLQRRGGSGGSPLTAKHAIIFILYSIGTFLYTNIFNDHNFLLKYDEII